MDDAIKNLIKEQVEVKVQQLSTWRQVRWHGGRLHYESTVIENEISDYDTSRQLLYLETLLSKKFTLQVWCMLC